MLALPSAIAGAASGPALPPSKYGGSCSGDMPVVVASDAGAQSDVYSAVTLAGALGTDCVVLAGARGAAMPADQRARLEAADAGGYIVGGAAAVPDCKLAGRKMARIAGADRWATAEAVGAEAKRIADGNPSTPRAIPDKACPASTWTATGFKAIAAGSGHTCAIRTDNKLACWGRNEIGQGEAPSGKFNAIASGEAHTCAIRTDNTLACWGWNEYGQTDAPSGKFNAIAAGPGGAHTCAIRTDNTLACWGINDVGQASPPAGKFNAIAAGSTHTCAIRTDNTLACWGRNGYGQTDAPSGKFKAIAAGSGHTCAIRTDNTLACWGLNDSGQTDAPAAVLALPSAIAGAASGPALPPSKYGGSCAGDTPVVVASDAGAQSDIYSAVTLAGVLGTDCVVLSGPRGEAMPAAQARRLAAADAGGYIVGGAAAVPDCKLAGRKMARLAGADRWATAEAVGAEAKRIADGNPSTPRAIPDKACPAPPTSTGYKAIGTHGALLVGGFVPGAVCAIRTNGTLACWGPNYDNAVTGETADFLAQGTRADTPTGKYKAVTGGTGFTCAIRTDDTLACWGSGGGADGVPAGKFKAIAAGGDYACAIRTDDTLTCWGYNDYGETDAPAGKFKAVAAGGLHACAIRTNGTLACWGSNDVGEASPPSGKFKAVAAGGAHTCAIRTNGKAICWGRNDVGQTDAPAAGKFKAVSAGGGHACAIRTGDTLACWGYNDDGQASPPSGKFKAVAAGGAHTCAIRTNGKAICWGRDYDGQADAPPA